jgi:hypothetical protein
MIFQTREYTGLAMKPGRKSKKKRWGRPHLFNIRQLLKLGLGLFDDAAKPSRVGDSQLGKDLAVDADLGLLHAVYQAAIGQSVVTGGSVYPGDPESPEITLANAAITKGIAKGAVYGFSCAPEQFAAGATIALGKL